MKHTSIEVPIVPSEFTRITKQWQDQGFFVLQNVIIGHEGEESAVKSMLDDIAKEFPDHEPLETFAACQGSRMFVAAKCKVKEEKK